MPSIDVHPPRADLASPAENPLPRLLQTPSGLAIVEVQGTIHIPRAAGTGETLAGKLIFPSYSGQNGPDDLSWMKRVYLYVGKHQRLTGEVKKLGRPIAVIRKKEITDESMQLDGEEQVEIVEIVRHKVMFSQRPEPVSGE